MLNPATQITLSTLRIECHTPTGASTGTGFLFNFEIVLRDQRATVPVIVTNKHVVNDATRLQTTISLMPKGSLDQLREDCTAPNIEHRAVIVENLQRVVVRYPDPAVDLCVILIGSLINDLTRTHDLRHMFLSESWLPDAVVRQLLRPVEPVVMIGYPNGLWDAINNLPIIRDGLTGSHPLLDWNGQHQFIVDAACFPGSSGSPVFLFEDGMYRSGPGGYSPGTRVCLLGILWGGPLFSIEGRIEQRQIPTNEGDVPVFNAMMNLGFVVRAEALMTLKQEIQRLLAHQQQ